MAVPEISKAIVLVRDEDDWENAPQLVEVDVIEYSGHLWLVPEWLEYPDEDTTMPARIVRPLRQQFQKNHAPEGHYALPDPIPRGALTGHIPRESEHAFVSIERPRIRIRGA